MKGPLYARIYGAGDISLGLMTGEYPPPHDKIDAFEEERTKRLVLEWKMENKMTGRMYFARYFTLDQVNHCVRLLSIAAERSFPSVSEGQETFEYKAPDGDVVFAGIMKEPGTYICRLHREVFDERGGESTP